jgi:hypothetical protein
MSKMGSSLLKLLRFGAAALKPSKHGDSWHHAAVSAKAAARLRKAALLEGRRVRGVRASSAWGCVGLRR